MKPKDLKTPYSWEDRHVLLQEKILFVPNHYSELEKFQFPGWESPKIFGNSNPIKVEFCSGNGAWVLQKAIESPEVNWVAVEKRFDRSRKIYSKLKNHELDNLFVVCGDALVSSKSYFPSESIDEIFVNFPDPWPKKRHAKHRIIQENFVVEASRLLSRGKRVVMVTDAEIYRDQMIKTFLSSPLFRPSTPAPYYVCEWVTYGTSYFDTLWRSMGRKINFIVFEKA